MTDIIGYTAGFFLMWSFLPQVIKTAKTRDTEGLSIAMLTITLLSGVLYEIYALLLGLLPVLIMNGVFVLLVLLQLIMTLSFKKSV
jgi:MtN3 and saliva related transmembrane protein